MVWWVCDVVWWVGGVVYGEGKTGGDEEVEEGRCRCLYRGENVACGGGRAGGGGTRVQGARGPGARVGRGE